MKAFVSTSAKKALSLALLPIWLLGLGLEIIVAIITIALAIAINPVKVFMDWYQKEAWND